MFKVKVKFGQVTHGVVRKSYVGTKWITLCGDNGKTAKFESEEEAIRFLDERMSKYPKSFENVVDINVVKA